MRLHYPTYGQSVYHTDLSIYWMEKQRGFPTSRRDFSRIFLEPFLQGENTAFPAAPEIFQVYPSPNKESNMSEQRPVAIVTGAASNIGLACTQRFAATHTVIMADIAEATQQAASLPHAVAVRVNVGEFDSCLNLATEARKYGRIDAVVHSAGITRPALLHSGYARGRMGERHQGQSDRGLLSGQGLHPSDAGSRAGSHGVLFFPGRQNGLCRPRQQPAQKPRRITARPRQGSSRSSSRWQWSLPPTESG